MGNHLIAAKAAIAASLAAIMSFLGWKGSLAVAWVFLVALDWLTGSLAAFKCGEWSSARAREGAWHKLGSLIIVTVALMADFVFVVIFRELPFLNVEWPIVLFPMVLAWHILTEAGSILENAVKMGAPAPAWLIKCFKIGLKKVDAAGDSIASSLETEDNHG